MFTLIILIILNLLLLLPILMFSIPNAYYRHLYNYTIYYCQNFLGYIISIVAKIRTGKTTLLSGLSHVYQLIIIQKNQQIMEDVRNVLYHLDWNQVECFILEAYDHGIRELDQLANLVLSFFSLDGNQLYYDFLEFKPVKELIRDYVEAFYVVNIRKQYVYSRTYFYSHITHKSSLVYDYDWIKIKESYRNKTYAIFDNMIELIDEYSDEAGYGKNFEDMKDESGAREYRRKYGHLHRERNYFIYTKQDSSDEVKKYRDITQSHLQIVEKVKVVGAFPVLDRLLAWIYDFPSRINYFRFTLMAFLRGYFTLERREPYLENKLKSNQFGKKLQHKVYTIRRFLFSHSYCQFNIRHYYEAEHVGKENHDGWIYYEAVRFVIPLRYCFGTFTRYEYNYIQKQLLHRSEIDFEDLIESTMFPDENKKYFEFEETGAVYYEY